MLGATLGITIAFSGYAPDANAQAINKQGGPTPDYHVVRDGDTLYDLSGRFYGDAYAWPRLWGNNPHITNPHWIYPGDIVYLRAPGNKQQAQQNITVDDPTRGESGGAGMHLPVGGFVTSDKLEYAGKIRASDKEAVLLGDLDEVWVGFEKEEDEEDAEGTAFKSAGEVKEGDVFAIVRDDGPVRNADGDQIGRKYIVLGALTITKTDDKYYDTGRIIQSWQEIVRGDLLIPYERQLKVVQPIQAEEEMVAEIIDAMAPIHEFGESHYVFVNKGAENNVRVGNRFFIYQRAEGLDRPGSEPGEKIPWRIVGQVMLLDVRENVSLGIITDTDKEVHIGDRLEMYPDY
jgi:hypothetical protein